MPTFSFAVACKPAKLAEHVLEDLLLYAYLFGIIVQCIGKKLLVHDFDWTADNRT